MKPVLYSPDGNVCKTEKDYDAAWLIPGKAVAEMLGKDYMVSAIDPSYTFAKENFGLQSQPINIPASVVLHLYYTYCLVNINTFSIERKNSSTISNWCL